MAKVAAWRRWDRDGCFDVRHVEPQKACSVNNENVGGKAIGLFEARTTSRARFWVIGTAVAIAALRLYECGILPTETGDIVRHVLYGVAVDTHGVAAAGQRLTELSSAWSSVAWARFPYNYPPLALAFFALVASISPTLFAAKLALTLVEAANAWLIGKLTGSRVLGVIYWASPLSIWWVSREGQFEPLQALFMLLAIRAALSLPFVCGLMTALAVSVKVTAGALMPWMTGQIWPSGRRARIAAMLGLALGSIPLIASQALYGGISDVLRYSALLTYNPYYWNPWADMFTGNAPVFIVVDEIASYGLLAVLIALAVRSGNWLAYFAPIAFVVFCKVHSNVEFWYWLLLPAFLVPIPHARWRFALIALCPLLDIHSAVELITGPIGPVRFHGLPSVFDLYTLP